MNKNKICLVCSSGGHFSSLYYLKEFWEEYEHFWVTFQKSDVETLLQNEAVFWAYHPTNRNTRNFIRNIFLALKILREQKPSLVISSGAGVGASFIFAAKLLGIKTVYFELFTRVYNLSLTAKLVYPIVDHLVVQWPELAKKYRKAQFVGLNL